MWSAVIFDRRVEGSHAGGMTEVIGAGERASDSTSAMPLARFGDREFAAADIDAHSASWPKPLLCWGCEVKVAVVRSFPKEKGRTAAHFRRYPGLTHGPNCVYDVHAQVTQIAEDSDGLLQYRKRVWRLVAPDVLQRPTPELREVGNDRPSPTYARRMTTLLNTAGRVADLIERFRLDGGDLSEAFAAVCDGKVVTWHEFMYQPRVVWRLAHRLDEQPVDHPVAVAMRVSRSGLARTGQSAFLEQPVPGPWTDVTDDRDYHVVIRSKTVELLADYRPGVWLIALGTWRLFPWKSGRRTDVCLWVDAPHQLVTVAAPPSRPTVRYQS